MLITNRKACKFARGRANVAVDATDATGHLIAERIQKTVELIRGTLGGQFDAPIWQVSHHPGDFVAPGDALRRVPEADALHASREKQLSALEGKRTHDQGLGTRGGIGPQLRRPGINRRIYRRLATDART